MMIFENIEPSIKFIEENLDENFTLEEVAEKSNISLSHFYKIILASTGFTVKEYIRNKKLKRAAEELLKTHRRIIDIAVDAGFNSHETFTRAFTRLYGIGPKKYRLNRKDIDVFSNYSLFGKNIENKYLKCKEDLDVNVKVIDGNKMILVGMEYETSVREAIESDSIACFWKNEFIPRINEIKYIKKPYVSVSYEVHNPKTDKLYHLASLEVEQINIPKGMVSRIIPPTKYAVFSNSRAINPVEYGMLSEYIYGEWLPMSGYRLLDDFVIDMSYSDVYYCQDFFSKEHLAYSKNEVYIPII